MASQKTFNLNFAFWFHLFLTILAWVGPFTIDWRIMAAVYAIIQIQFMFLGKCVMNESHGGENMDEDATFYSEVFDLIGLNVPKKPLKMVVRNGLYIALGLVAFYWQYVLEHTVLIELPF